MDDKCFALKMNSRCCILLDSSQCGEKCSFYKTAEQYKNNLQLANARLVALDTTTQTYIADKYFQGIKPWLRKEAVQ